MMKTLAIAVALSCCALAAPAAASTTISFTGGNSATDGPDGNVRTFTVGGISVKASAWSRNSSSTLSTAWLGDYSHGLGVTNDSEGNGGSNNSHTIDNVGQNDFVLLVFNQAVNLSSAVLTPFAVAQGPQDNDAYVSYASLANAFGTTFTTSSSIWSTLGTNGYNVSGNNNSPYLTNLNSSGLYGNVWLIGAAFPSPDRYYDGFKLSSIVVNTPAVPEPSTWAMMLVGFGAAGAAMRRTRRRPAIAQMA